MKRSVDLATRHVGSIEVTLIWDRQDGSLAVSAQDGMTGEDLLLPVSADEAAEVYRHPFAYADRLRPRTGNGESLEQNVPADSVA
jgi:hypothetical protein